VSDALVAYYVNEREKAIGQMVRRRRIELGLSQFGIADLIGTSRARIARIEDGQNSYSQAEIEVLSRFLEMDPRDFLDIPFPKRWALEMACSPVLDTKKAIRCALPPGAFPRMKSPFSPSAYSLPFPLFTFSPDGELLAARFRYRADGDGDDTVRNGVGIWDTLNGELLASHMPGDDAWVSQIVFSPDGLRVAFIAEEEAVYIWNWTKNTVVTCLDPKDSGYTAEFWEAADQYGDTGVVSKMAWSPDGRHLVTYNEGLGVLRIWNIAKQEQKTLVLPAMIEKIEKDMERKLIENAGFEELCLSHLGFTPDGESIVFTTTYGGGNTAGQKIFFLDLLGDSPDSHFTYVWARDSVRSLLFAPVPVEPVDQNKVQYILYVGGGDGEAGLYQVLLVTREHDDGYWRSTEYYGDLGLPRVSRQMCRHQDGDVISVCEWGLYGANLETGGWTITNLHSFRNLIVSSGRNDKGPSKIVLSPHARQVAFCADEGYYLLNLDIQPLKTRARHYPQPWMQELRDRLQIQNEEDMESLARTALWDRIVEEATEQGDSIREVPPQRPGAPPRPSLQSLIHHWKTTTPAAEGGYGLAALAPGNTDTVRAKQVLEERLGEKICLVTASLLDGGAPVNRRRLIELILDRDLEIGELTDTAIEEIKEEEPFDMIWIDHAENLDYSVLTWICSNLRKVTGAFVLIVRDENKFAALVHTTPSRADWIWHRSFSVRFGDVLALKDDL